MPRFNNVLGIFEHFLVRNLQKQAWSKQTGRKVRKADEVRDTYKNQKIQGVYRSWLIRSL